MGKVIELNTLNDRTRIIYQKECKKFRKYFYKMFGIFPEKSNPETIQLYVDCCYPDLIKHSSVFKIHLAAVRKWCNHQNFPDFSLKSPRLDPDPITILSVSQVREIFKEARNHPCSLMLRMIYESGVRLQEVTRIRIRDIDFEKMILSIKGDDRSPSRESCIPEDIKYDLIRLVHKRDENEFLFTLRIMENGSTAPISRRTLQQYLNRISERIGAGKINTQTLRDSYAVHMILEGYDLRLIMSRLGLKNIRSMNRYIRYIDTSLKDTPVLRSPLCE